MFVGLKMRKNFKTVSSQTALSDAVRMLGREQALMVLVVDEGRLVGCIRKQDVEAALRQSLGAHRTEESFQTHRLTVAMAMRKNIMPVPPEMEIETAARLMHDNGLAGLAVMAEDGGILGYINHDVMLEVLLEEMGGGKEGHRLVFEAKDRPGILQEVAGVVSRRNVNIISTSIFQRSGRLMIVLRLCGQEDPQMRDEIESLGYRLGSASDFTSEWMRENIQ